MNYLIYVSQAVQPFTNDALTTLLQYSRTRNKAEGITGLLLYRYVNEPGRGNFMQLLEGDRGALDAVWLRISEDERHHSIIVLEEGTSDARMFKKWTMGFRNAEQADLAAFEGFEDLGSDSFWQRLERDTTSGALDLLRSFYHLE